MHGVSRQLGPRASCGTSATSRRHRARGGFSLLECAVSALLVGMLMVGALRALNAAKRREISTTDSLGGRQLACDLMNEILLQAYKEPFSVSVFGREPDEDTGDRTRFDDVDDYHNWTATPPTDRSGVPIPGFAGWTQAVSVEWADPNHFGATPAINTGLKRITVSIRRQGRSIASVIGYRSVGWADTVPNPEEATGNQSPVAVATSPDLTRRVGEVVTFVGTSSSDPDGDSLSYVWDFGNGNTGAGATVTHVYSAAGNYTCTLTVYDGRGGIGMSTVVAIISP